MASLNTLRTRGGVIISIVIGIALLAFLLGDIGARSCTDTSVGSIEGYKVRYEEYVRQTELYHKIAQGITGKESLSSEEIDAANNMAWEALVFTHAYEPGFEKLGLSNSEAEQVDMVNGAYLSPVIVNTFTNPQTGVYDPALLRNFISNAEFDTSGQAITMWNYLKRQMNEQRSTSKYIKLISNGMYTNDLEVNAGIDASNKAYNANIVSFNYNIVADSLVKVTGNDIRAYYSDHKDRFKQQPSREIEYVVFDMLPSEDDYEDALKYIEEIAAEFETAENPMQYATLNSQTAPNTTYLKDTQMDGAMAAAIFGKPEAMYGPALNGDIYTVARQADIKMLPDTVGAKHILLEPGQNELADSLMNVIKKGGDFAELAKEYSFDQTANMAGGDLGRFSPEVMVPEFSEALIAAKPGDIFTVETRYGIHVVEMTYRTAPVEKAQIATIRYKVDPSSATQQTIYAEASKFLMEANGSYDNFNKAATEAALAKRVARIRNTDRTVSSMEDSKELVRWAFDNKKGQVSDIKEIGGDYVVAVVTAVREEGIAKVEDVADAIRPIVTAQKKADIIINEKIKGATLSEVAANSGNEAAKLEGITFNDFFLDGIGVEQKLVGAITSTSETNKLSKPVRGETGVFVFEVTEMIATDNDATPESERVRIDATNTTYIDQRVSQAMFENSNIKDNRVKFF